MLKNRTIIEVEIKGREFRLECYSESPLEDVADALASMSAYVTERIKVSKTSEIAPEEVEIQQISED